MADPSPSAVSSGLTSPAGAWLRPAGRVPHDLDKAKHPATIQRILAAAEQIFAARGMAGARTDQIARAARVNKALLYYYFGSKEKLHRAVLERLFSQLRESIETARAASALPRQRLLAFVNGYFDFVLAHPNYPRLVQRELMDRGPHLGWMVSRYLVPQHRRLCRAIQAGIASRDFRRVDPDQTVLTLIAMTVFYFAAAPILTEIWGRDALRARAVAARRHAILDFLEHGLFRPRSRHR